MRNCRNCRGASETSQFIVVLYILFLILIVPLLDLAAVFTAAATQYLATNDFVAKAATQPTYATALNTMTSEAYQFQLNGLARFAGMVPNGGYTGCGDDLYVMTTNLTSGAVTNSSANQPLTQPIDTAANIYELSVHSIYDVGPFISLASIPIIGSVPGLGVPATFSFNASRPIEHPGGFQSRSADDSSAAALTPFPRSSYASGGTIGAVQDETWRTRDIFDRIKAAGQTVMSVNVVIVMATNPNWTATGLTINPGERVWLDTQAVGSWSAMGTLGKTNYFDANGTVDGSGVPITPTQLDPTTATQQYVPAPNLPITSLVGMIGAGNQCFFVGNTQYNYSPTSVGLFSLICNDGYTGFADNDGAQMVRIIVTR